MQKHQLVINQRFIIDEDLQTLKDLQTGTTTRLELRLLLLIGQLAKHKKEVVSRAQLINDIWDNYGGAEEGLNQAISTLRKLLGDTDKKMIETVPKKGYLLNAEVNEGLQSNRTVVRYIAFIAVLLFVGWTVVMFTNTPDRKAALEPNGALEDTTYQKKELDSIRKNSAIENKKH